MSHKSMALSLITLPLLVGFLLFALGRRECLISSARDDILATISKYGGISQLYDEIDRAFAKLSALEGTALTRIRIEASASSEFPILINLGRAVQVFPATDARPQYIMILRGGHYSTHIISVFDPDIDSTALSAWSEGALSQITNGVYLTR